MSYSLPNGWTTDVRGWLGRVSGRTVWALATPEAVIAAHALDDDATTGDASLQMILALRELSTELWSFGTNHSALREAIAADETIAGPHIQAVDPAACPPGDPTMEKAHAAALAAYATRGPVYLRAATDGSRAKKRASGGFGWVTATGQYGFGSIRTTCPLESELVAVEKLLAATRADQPLSIEIDSRAAIKLVNLALDRDAAYPSTVTTATGSVLDRIRLHAGRQITVCHVKGHQDDAEAPVSAAAALNVAADKLAGLGRTGLDYYLTEERVATIARTKVDEALATLRGERTTQAPVAA